MKLFTFDPPLSERWARLSPGQKCVFPFVAVIVGAAFVICSPLLLLGYMFFAWESFWNGDEPGGH